MRVCLIPGDGIGPEVIAAARRVLDVLAPGCDIVDAEAGFRTFEVTGTALPERTVEVAAEADATLLGAVGSPSHRVAGYSSPVVGLRRALDLFACVRPVRTPPLAGPRADVDMVIVREATEGLYVGREHREGDTATAQRVVTVDGSRRIARAAAELARRDGRSRVTVVHKANVLRETCGLFREVALHELASHDLIVDEMIVDAAAYRIVSAPQEFDVIVTTNLFGDILSDVAAPWAGGLGLCASATVGDRHAIFEPVHGAAPDIAGKGIANPCATLSALAGLLDHLDHRGEADLLRDAIDTVLRHDVRTPDIGGTGTTDDVVDAVLGRLECRSHCGRHRDQQLVSTAPGDQR